MVQPVRSALFLEIEEKGYAIVPGTISTEKCEEYISSMHDWLESYEMGYKRDDKSTWSMDNIPFGHGGGLYNNYQIGHIQFAWDIRQEPGVIAAFADAWGTDELVVSFDAVNISLPLLKEGEITKKWGHQDQSPNKKDLWCIQGIANLAPNGPKDGGLMVLKGSRALNNELFETFSHLKEGDSWPTVDYYQYSEEQLQWLYDRGCVWEKVCANPGDLILWDSRTAHYGAAPEFGGRGRFAGYVCMSPVSQATPKQLAAKREAFEKVITTTHAPIDFRLCDAKADRQNGKEDPAWSKYQELMKGYKPILSQRGLQLAGVLPY